MKRAVRIILDNVRSAHNVGSIFRTADGAGAERVYLLGYTPDPIDRFGREQKEIAKTSLGASLSVSWEHIDTKDAPALLARLKAEGFQIVAVEQTERSIPLAAFTVLERACYIFGNEVEGVAPDLLALADTVIEIPMQGTKESLNVSVAAGVVLFGRASY